jgi:hypothetical protein
MRPGEAGRPSDAPDCSPGFDCALRASLGHAMGEAVCGAGRRHHERIRNRTGPRSNATLWSAKQMASRALWIPSTKRYVNSQMVIGSGVGRRSSLNE